MWSVEKGWIARCGGLWMVGLLVVEGCGWLDG